MHRILFENIAGEDDIYDYEEVDEGPSDGMPGKCALSSEMEMFNCFAGHGEDKETFELIKEHYAAHHGK